MKFPFWLLPIILSTTLTLALQAYQKERISEKDKKDRKIILVILIVIGVLASLGMLVFLNT